MASKVARKDRGREVPDGIKGNDDGQAFFGILDGALASDDGRPIEADEVATIALTIIGIIKDQHRVDVWSNDIAQNKMRNAIDDYFFDVLRDERGIELPVEVVDDLELKIMNLARARLFGPLHPRSVVSVIVAILRKSNISTQHLSDVPQCSNIFVSQSCRSR